MSAGSAGQALRDRRQGPASGAGCVAAHGKSRVRGVGSHRPALAACHSELPFLQLLSGNNDNNTDTHLQGSVWGPGRVTRVQVFSKQTHDHEILPQRRKQITD